MAGWRDRLPTTEQAASGDPAVAASPLPPESAPAPPAPAGGWRERVQASEGRGGLPSPLPPSQALPPTTAGQAWNLDIPQEPRRSPGFDVSSGAGVIDDPTQRLEFLSEQTGIALDRLGYDGRGRAVYRDDAGQLRYLMDTPDRLAQFAGGSALPIAGGMAGMVAGGPGGAALGAAAGEGVERLMANALGEVQPPVFPNTLENYRRFGPFGGAVADVVGGPDTGSNAMKMAYEAILAYAGAKVGDIIGRKAVDRKVVRDLPRMNEAEARRLIAIAKRHGIDLTPAEATNLGSLKHQQTTIGMGSDEGADILQRWYGERSGQVARALDEWIGAPPHVDVAGAQARTVAGQAIDDAKAARTAASRPYYRMADRQTAPLPERPWADLEADPVIAKYIDRVHTEPLWRLQDAPRNSVATVDAAAKAMREDALKLPQGSYERGTLEGLRKRLLGFMERQVPVYREGRTQFARASDPVNVLEEGLEGVIARTKDTALGGIPDKLLTGKNLNPATVADWRRQFITQGKAQEWDDLVAAWLRREWGTIKTTQGQELPSGAAFKKRVFGSENQKKILREALGKDAYNAFSDLMDVLSATGRVQKGQSITKFAQQSAADERRAVAPISSRLGETINPVRMVADWMADTQVDQWHAEVARAITSPAALDELKRLRVLEGASPLTRAKLQAVTMALSRAGIEPFASAARTPPESTPPRTLQAPRGAQRR